MRSMYESQSSVRGGSFRSSVMQRLFEDTLTFCTWPNQTNTCSYMVESAPKNSVVNMYVFLPDQVVSGIDIQSIEPVDTKMRDSLMKSIQMAIEISTM